MFDRTQLHLEPLAKREHDLTRSVIQDPVAVPAGEIPAELAATGRALVEARDRGASSIFMMEIGRAHV